MEVFFQWKDWIRAFILRGLYFGYLPPLPPFIMSELLRGQGGGGEDRSLQPAPDEDLQPRPEDSWSWASSGLGDREGSAFIWVVPNKMRPEKSIMVQVPLPIPKSGSCPATSSAMCIHREGHHTVGATGWKSGC